MVIRTAGSRKTWSESATLSGSVHSCVRCVWNKGSGGKNGHGSVSESGSDSGSKSKTWILIWF